MRGTQLATNKPADMTQFWALGMELRLKCEQIGEANTPGQKYDLRQREAIKWVRSLGAALDEELPLLAAKMMLAEKVDETWSAFPGYSSLREVIEGELPTMTYTEFNCLLNLNRVIIPALQELGIDPLPHLAKIKKSNWFDLIPALRVAAGIDSDNRPVSPSTQNIVEGYKEEAMLLAGGDERQATKAVVERLLEAGAGSNARLRSEIRPGADATAYLVDNQFLIINIHSEDEMSAVLKQTARWLEMIHIGSTEINSCPDIRAFVERLSIEPDEGFKGEYDVAEAMMSIINA